MVLDWEGSEIQQQWSSLLQVSLEEFEQNPNACYLLEATTSDKVRIKGTEKRLKYWLASLNWEGSARGSRLFNICCNPHCYNPNHIRYIGQTCDTQQFQVILDCLPPERKGLVEYQFQIEYEKAEQEVAAEIRKLQDPIQLIKYGPEEQRKKIEQIQKCYAFNKAIDNVTVPVGSWVQIKNYFLTVNHLFDDYQKTSKSFQEAVDVTLDKYATYDSILPGLYFLACAFHEEEFKNVLGGSKHERS